MQPLFSSFPYNFYSYEEKISEITLKDKVEKIAKKIFICLAAALLFATSTIFFTPGLLLGFFKNKKTEKNLKKINLFLQTQPREALLITGIGAFLSLPITWGAVSFFTGAYLGSSLYRNAKRIKNNKLGF